VRTGGGPREVVSGTCGGLPDLEGSYTLRRARNGWVLAFSERYLVYPSDSPRWDWRHAEYVFDALDQVLRFIENRNEEVPEEAPQAQP
jgi:hypothetical protein